MEKQQQSPGGADCCITKPDADASGRNNGNGSNAAFPANALNMIISSSSSSSSSSNSNNSSQQHLPPPPPLLQHQSGPGVCPGGINLSALGLHHRTPPTAHSQSSSSVVSGLSAHSHQHHLLKPPSGHPPPPPGLFPPSGSPDSTSHNHSNNNSTTPTSKGMGSSTTGTGTGGPSPSMYSLKWNTQLLALQRSLTNLWESGIGTDAVLLCQGTPLPVHKIILTAASPYVASVVQTMATSSHMMPVIVLDIPAEAGKALLSFLYCGEAHVPVSIIPQLVIGAKFLGISGFGEPGVLESLTGMIPDASGGQGRGGVGVPSPSPSPSSIHDHKSISTPSSHRGSESPFGRSSESGDLHHHNNLSSHNNNPQISHLNKSKGGDPTRFSMMSEARSKAGSMYPIHFSSGSSGKGSSASSGAGGPPGLLPKKAAKGRVFMGGTSILDNLLKTPRSSGIGSHSSQSSTLNYDSPVNLSCSSNSNSGSVRESSVDRDRDQHQTEMTQFEAEGYGGSGSPSPHHHHEGLYYGRVHGQYVDDSDLMDQGDGDGDNGPIPAQLLEPNVEYHIGNEFMTSASDRFPPAGSHLHNPLIDLAKVASTMQAHQQQQQQQGGNERGSKRKNVRGGAAAAAAAQLDGGNGIEMISSSGRGGHSILEAGSPPTITPPVKVKAKKPPEPIICDICGKKFSNAYNLRVHMEGHSGQVFVCSVCNHASRSRDALRKHFAYRHRELWISGMSAFRKNVPGRKLSISRSNSIIKQDPDGNEPNNNNNNSPPNNNTLLDANGNINLNSIRGGGSDGTLTISEAFPDNSQKGIK